MPRHIPEETPPEPAKSPLKELGERLDHLLQLAERLNPDFDRLVRSIDREFISLQGKSEYERERWCLDKIGQLERHTADLQQRRDQHLAEVRANHERYAALYAQVEAQIAPATIEARDQAAAQVEAAEAVYTTAQAELETARSGAKRIAAEDAAIALATAQQALDLAERTYQAARIEIWCQLLAKVRADRAAARQNHEQAIVAHEHAIEVEDQAYEQQERDVMAARQLEQHR